MQRIILLLIFVGGSFFTMQAQDDLFGNLQQKNVIHHGFLIGFNGNFDIPAADMAARYGLSYKIGAAFSYKTKKNWIIGVKGDYILGGKVKQDSLMYNVLTQDGNFVDINGTRSIVGIYERGYMIGVEAGKIINLSKKSSENGLFIKTGFGFIQHKIKIHDKDGVIAQIRGDYVKGYDRLTNGLYVEQFAGYNHFAQNGIFNYYIGLNFLAGFTKCRRDYLYDVMHTDDKNRVDILFGVRGGWYFPIFKKKSEDIYY